MYGRHETPIRQFMQSTTEVPYSVPVSHLGIHSVEALRAPIHEYIQSHTEAVLDLSQVETYDAIGLQLLYSCQKTAEQAGRQLKIVHAAPALTEVMESLGLQREAFSALAAK